MAILFIAATLGCRPRGAPLPRQVPNLLLVTIETLRVDHVGAIGYPRNITPNLDRLARQGAFFSQAVAQAPFTLPSLATLMTGLAPPAHSVRDHPSELPSELDTLAERLSRTGYRTAAMTRHSWLRRRWGFDQGFDEYHNNTFSAGLDGRSLSLAAIDWLETWKREKSSPFFLWLHFLDPHLPYTAGYPYSVLFHPEHQNDEPSRHLRSMIDRDRTDFLPTPYADLAGGPYIDLVLRYYPENPILMDLVLWRRPRGEIFFGKKRYPDAAVAEMRDLYDGAILYTDDNLARLLQALGRLGLEETTLVVVTGDHGEALGEHELFFTHDFTLYDEVLRVPLVLRFPGRIPPGVRVDQQVRLLDVAPTVLDLLGVETADSPKMEGVSLAPLLRGGTLPFLPAFAESAPFRHQFPEHRRIYYQGNRGKWRMVRTEQWKLLLIPHPQEDLYELYDLVNDPGETRNLYDALPGEAGKLRPLLDAWLERDLEGGAGPTGDEEKALEELDPASRQLLETLGYIR